MMHFQTEVDMLKFSVDCREIRRVIADINCEFETRRMSEVIKFDNYRIQWLPLIESFIGKWGLARVTSDIAWAVNDVQEAIHVETTCFPPFLPYYSDGVSS